MDTSYGAISKRVQLINKGILIIIIQHGVVNKLDVVLACGLMYFVYNRAIWLTDVSIYQVDLSTRR